MAKEYVVKVKADTKEFDSSIQKVDKGVQGVESSTGAATGALDKFTGGAVTAFKNGVAGAKRMALSMKSLRAAVISTGIGAIAIAVIAIIQAISRLQGVQDRYKQASAALGVIVDSLLDKLAFLGEALIKAFENPQKALQDFGNLLVENIVNRFEGILKLVPRLSKAVALLFQCHFHYLK